MAITAQEQAEIELRVRSSLERDYVFVTRALWWRTIGIAGGVIAVLLVSAWQLNAIVMDRAREAATAAAKQAVGVTASQEMRDEIYAHLSEAREARSSARDYENQARVILLGLKEDSYVERVAQLEKHMGSVSEAAWINLTYRIKPEDERDAWFESQRGIGGGGRVGRALSGSKESAERYQK